MIRNDSGFTLIEIIIVTAVIGIIAGIAMPNLITSRSIANERAIIATLRSISTAQAQVLSQRVVDADSDSCGEALSLAELAGLVGLRNSATMLVPPSLPASLGMLNAAGYATTRGYLIALYLPNAAGQGLIGSASNLGSIDTNLAETSWSCIAWPLTRGNTGSATFFVNQTGEIVASRQATYSGAGSVPPCGAALVGVPSTVIVGGDLATDAIGADGNLWNTLR